MGCVLCVCVCVCVCLFVRKVELASACVVAFVCESERGGSHIAHSSTQQHTERAILLTLFYINLSKTTKANFYADQKSLVTLQERDANGI